MSDFFRLMLRRISILLVIVLLVCGCYDRHSSGETEFIDMRNCSLSSLRSMGAEGCNTIDLELICVGRVTSSDREGNFYRSLFIEDESGGAEILLGTYNIASQYPIGLQVAIHLKGTAVAVEDGVVKIGLPPQSYDSAPREMEAQAVIDCHLIRGTSIEDPTPHTYRIGELEMPMCGQFIRIEGLLCSPELWNEGETMVGYRAFTDEEGAVIYTSVSEYASFADMATPSEIVTIEGILSYEAVGEGRQYVIKPRSKDDFTQTHSIN